jgi:hypothetical protein
MVPGILVLIAAAGCGGVRHVPPPENAQGYRHVEIHDIALSGLKDQNVEIVAFIAAGGVRGFEDDSSDCNIDTIDLTSAAPPNSADAASVASFTASFPDLGVVEATLPRERSAEVRALAPLEKVRVRGYLSTYVAKGCSRFTEGANRFLWIDSIERVEPTAKP